jgi:hypothetical protein
MSAPAFSFDALETHLAAIPDGPASVFNTSRWQVRINRIGWAGALIALLPSLLIQFMDPAVWMVWTARIGLGVEIAGFFPAFVRSAAVLGISFRHWRREQVRQLDHDFEQFRQLRAWLSQCSTDSREEALRFVRGSRERLGSKLHLLVGGIDKLGVLPVAVAVALQWKEFSGESADISLWWVLVALFLLLLYAIGFVTSLMRIRLELYEMVLSDSIESRSVQAPTPAG